MNFSIIIKQIPAFVVPLIRYLVENPPFLQVFRRSNKKMKNCQHF
jgi:hypothetical protein